MTRDQKGYLVTLFIIQTIKYLSLGTNLKFILIYIYYKTTYVPKDLEFYLLIA